MSSRQRIVLYAFPINDHDAMVVKSLPIGDFAKILVFGDQDPCVLHGYFKEIVTIRMFDPG